jgi:hypothetical protein
MNDEATMIDSTRDFFGTLANVLVRCWDARCVATTVVFRRIHADEGVRSMFSPINKFGVRKHLRQVEIQPFEIQD